MMQRVLFLLLAVLLLSMCDHAANRYIIETEIEGSQGKWLKLTGRTGGKYITLDSALVDSAGRATISGSIDGVQTRYLTIEGSRGKIQMLLENATYSIRGSMADPVIRTQSPAQLDLLDYNKGKIPLDNKMSDLYQAYIAATQSGDTAEINRIDQQYEAAYLEIQAYDSVYIFTHPDSYASVIALRGSFYNYETGALEAVLALLNEKLHSMSEYTYMHDIMQKQKTVAVGKPFMDFTLNTPEGKALSVSDVHQGQVLLIDFWASWCGPCRRANPELVRLYEKYHNRGFDILGVSLDSDSTSWIRAIKTDSLTWNQISDIKGWECRGAELYGVPAIPHTVLVDRKGIIRGKKLHGEELEEAIVSLL